MKMVIGALVAVQFVAVPASAATIAEVMDAKLNAMRISFACRPDSERGMYRVLYEAARRFAMQYSFELEGAERKVADLHRGLRDGKILPPQVDNGKCDALVEDAREDIRLLENEL